MLIVGSSCERFPSMRACRGIISIAVWSGVSCNESTRKRSKIALSTPCGKPAWQLIHHTNLEDALEEKKKLVCYACGVACDMTRMKEERIEFLQGLNAHRKEDTAAEPDALQPRTTRERGDRDRRHANLERADVKLDCVSFFALPSGGKRDSCHTSIWCEWCRVRFAVRATPLAYSGGYHPQPMLSFGPALRLGMAGLAELIEVAHRRLGHHSRSAGKSHH